MPKIAIASSGGGNRAAVFNLGVLLYLVDAAKHHDVCSIASVSGGSVMNGYIAQLGNLSTTNSAEFRAAVRPFLRRMATKGTLWAWWGTWLYLAVLLAALVLTAAVGVYPWARPLIRFPAMLLMLAIIGKLLLEKRGAVCGQALGATLFSPNVATTLLRDTASDAIDHVFCATELHAGEHVYFSGKFVCSYRLGWGTPADLPLCVAVQASAAFPGAFTPRVLPTAPHEFQDGKHMARWMLLLDGGVYDNMGDQWPMGIGPRKRRWTGHAVALIEPDEVIVVNACTNLRWGSVRRLFVPILNEIASMKRVIDVLYDNTTTPRRRALVAEFDRAAQGGGKPRGALVTLEQGPHQVASTFATATEVWPDRAGRARAALTALGNTEAHWRDIVRDNCIVPTTFRSLGSDVVARLLYQAYTTAMMNLHVILGYPLLTLPQPGDFENLLAEEPIEDAQQ
jgi:hypothetical protein